MLSSVLVLSSAPVLSIGLLVGFCCCLKLELLCPLFALKELFPLVGLVKGLQAEEFINKLFS